MRGLWERGVVRTRVCDWQCVLVRNMVCRGKSGLRQEPKAGPSSAVKMLVGVSRPFLLDEGLDNPVSQGPLNFDILTFQAVLSVSLRVLVL